jgi:hypothetical protein
MKGALQRCLTAAAATAADNKCKFVLTLISVRIN